MKREWKPGDVAAWDIDGQVEVVYFCHAGTDFETPKWQTADSGEGFPKPDQLRPLVVIDPEDREQVGILVDRLVAAYGEPLAYVREQTLDRYQAALRSLIDPPKPEEPTGLGAVVERSDGKRWVRGPSGRWTNLDATGAYLNWSEWRHINGSSPVVRVLSEGVRP